MNERLIVAGFLLIWKQLYVFTLVLLPIDRLAEHGDGPVPVRLLTWYFVAFYLIESHMMALLVLGIVIKVLAVVLARDGLLLDLAIPLLLLHDAIIFRLGALDCLILDEVVEVS